MVSVNETLCIRYGLYIVSCPEEAIEAESIAVVNDNTCTDCLECTYNCPVDTIKEAI
jgi:ferredoxin